MGLVVEMGALSHHIIREREEGGNEGEVRKRSMLNLFRGKYSQVLYSFRL